MQIIGDVVQCLPRKKCSIKHSYIYTGKAPVALCIGENRIVKMESQNYNKGCLMLSSDSFPILEVKFLHDSDLFIL